MASRPRSPVHLTAGLLEVLLEFAADADPRSVSVAMVATPAGELEGDVKDLEADAPVFSEFYLPEAGASINRVFGVELSVPPARAHGRFVSHPKGDLSVSMRDDLATRVVVATPPWTEEDVGAFDRRGRRLELSVLDAAPPERAPPE